MSPKMQYAARLINIWELAKLWNCKAWEVGKRPMTEVLLGLQRLQAEAQIAQKEKLAADLHEKLEEAQRNG